MQIAEQLLEDVEDSDHNKYVVVVGDGKTYDHLAKIKKVRSKQMERLLVYPGDWHILKNFQLLLMKIYYHCGLRELAKASGFRGETLTSLQHGKHLIAAS